MSEYISEYLVEEKHLNYIINFLSFEHSYRDDTNGECSDLLKIRGYDISKDNDLERLFKDMHNLNIQAVEKIERRLLKFQTKHNHDDDKATYSEGRFKHTANPHIHQALKSIHYWLYQCREMERSKLYVTFRKTMDTIITSAIAKILPPEFWKTYIKKEKILFRSSQNTTRGALI